MPPRRLRCLATNSRLRHTFVIAPGESKHGSMAEKETVVIIAERDMALLERRKS